MGTSGTKVEPGVQILTMLMRIHFYVGAVCVGALACLATLYGIAPAIDADQATAALCFAALGVFANALTYSVGRGTLGSIAFIPFLTAAVLAPSWVTVVAVATSMAAGEM